MVARWTWDASCQKVPGIAISLMQWLNLHIAPVAELSLNLEAAQDVHIALQCSRHVWCFHGESNQSMGRAKRNASVRKMADTVA